MRIRRKALFAAAVMVVSGSGAAQAAAGPARHDGQTCIKVVVEELTFSPDDDDC